jgi:hypothetical protein
MAARMAVRLRVYGLDGVIPVDGLHRWRDCDQQVRGEPSNKPDCFGASTMTGEEMLEHPVLWREFHKWLRLSLDFEHGRGAVRSFAKMLKLPHHVVNKMRTVCHPGNRTTN